MHTGSLSPSSITLNSNVRSLLSRMKVLETIAACGQTQKYTTKRTFNFGSVWTSWISASRAECFGVKLWKVITFLTLVIWRKGSNCFLFWSLRDHNIKVGVWVSCFSIGLGHQTLCHIQFEIKKLKYVFSIIPKLSAIISILDPGVCQRQIQHVKYCSHSPLLCARNHPVV